MALIPHKKMNHCSQLVWNEQGGIDFTPKSTLITESKVNPKDILRDIVGVIPPRALSVHP